MGKKFPIKLLGQRRSVVTFLFRYYFISRAPLSSLEIGGGRVIAAGRLMKVLQLARILAEESMYSISSRSEGLRLLLLGSLVRKIL